MTFTGLLTGSAIDAASATKVHARTYGSGARPNLATSTYTTGVRTRAAASLDRSAATIAPVATTATSSRRGLPPDSRAEVPASASKSPLRSATAAAPVRPTKKSRTFQWPATSETAAPGDTSPARTIATAPSRAA